MSRYLKVLKQIDKRMTAKGYTLRAVNDGEERITSENHTKTELYDWATQTDEGAMTYNDGNGNGSTFYLIYGNGLEDTIHDMGYNTEKAGEDCEQVADEINAFYEKMRKEYA